MRANSDSWFKPSFTRQVYVCYYAHFVSIISISDGALAPGLRGIQRRVVMKELGGKVAIVTAASKGIGARIARHLAAEGASVVVNYVSSKRGCHTVRYGETGAVLDLRCWKWRDQKGLESRICCKYENVGWASASSLIFTASNRILSLPLQAFSMRL